MVCGGMRVGDIPSFRDAGRWGERSLSAVANLTRQGARDFLPWAREVGVRTQVESFPLEQADDALERLAAGRIRGAAVLVP